VLLAILAHDEESLADSFVHNDHGDFWLGSGLVVKLADGVLELRNLFPQHLVTLGITNTIAVNHEVGWVSLVFLAEGLDRFAKELIHLVFDNLLTFPLDDVVAVVLTHLRVDRGREADYRLSTRVADIDTNQHRLLLVENLREL